MFDNLNISARTPPKRSPGLSTWTDIGEVENAAVGRSPAT
jgi:hypothetical protein